MAFVLCGAFAGVAGMVSLSQVAAAGPNFGLQREFIAIAAAVIGGTSLFGGRGTVMGVAMGAILIQTVQTGMVIINANPHSYPLVTAAIIFAAVFVDTLRSRVSQDKARRNIIHNGVQK